MHTQRLAARGEPCQGKRELTKLRNRETLIAAATDIFLEKGFEATTVRDIVNATDLALGTFYNYFADKEALFAAIVDEHIGRVAESVREFRRKATSQAEFVRFGYEAYFRGLAANPVSFELARRHETSIGSLNRIPMFCLAMEHLVEDIDDAKARGWLPDADSEYIAAAFVGVGHEISRVMVSRRPLDPDYAARFAAALFHAGLCELPRN